MNWFALALLATVVAAGTASCIAYLMLLHRFRRRHRVDPATATDAPVTWLADPRAPARLHRRLVKVGRATTLVAERHGPKGRRRRGRGDSVHAAALALRAEAVSVDAQVSRAAVLAPAARRDVLADIVARVELLESTCVGLLEVSYQATEPLRLDRDTEPLLTATRQVEHLAEAHRELLALDGQAGMLPERTAVQPHHDRPTTIAPAPPPPPGRRTAGR